MVSGCRLVVPDGGKLADVVGDGTRLLLDGGVLDLGGTLEDMTGFPKVPTVGGMRLVGKSETYTLMVSVG